MRAFRRFLTRPVISIAEAALFAAAVVTADAFHLYLHAPWWVLMLAAWGGTVLFAFGCGFVSGFARSMMADVKQWRAGR